MPRQTPRQIRRRRVPSVLILCLVVAAAPAAAVDVEIQPGDHVYLNYLEGRHPVYDLVLHGIRLRNAGDGVLVVEQVEVRADDGQGRAMVRQLAPEDSSSGPDLAAGEEALFNPVYLAGDFAPTSLTVTVRFQGPAGEAESATSVPVVRHLPDIEYLLPLEGTWYMRGIPSALSHHRWSQATEFAVDFFKTDGNGRIREGGPEDAENYFGYGADVLAAADGVAVMVIRGMVQDRGARSRGADEDDAAYSRRIAELNQQAMRQHGLGGATGNLIVLRHANGERSAYGHLKTGSLTVSEGDEVVRGQKIAEVGDTGDSSAVHLHFQVMEADAMRAIPFRFSDVRIVSTEFGSWILNE